MSGIRDLIPGSVIDATMFNPCGYSMNGMKTDVSETFSHTASSCLFIHLNGCLKCGFFPRRVQQGTYWTIHITPEPEFSYVSFETNLSQTSYDDLVSKVVDVFKPGKFVTTLFVNQVCKPSLNVIHIWCVFHFGVIIAFWFMRFWECSLVILFWNSRIP